ncbi:MAG: selenide, water dikinase SelD, partial [Actinomycetota bacterium]|nr:selenide, water dikinase SelD [Actinomycetota bacterium]
LDEPDDAAVYEVTPGVAIVQTVDFFTPIVDDPFAWGRIATANALSDVYAMGGRPITALNLIAWPRDLDFGLLGRVLEGANDACADANVTIVGGHSIDDPEPKFGQAVTGVIEPERIVRKRGARAGCDLVLTKPLGMGVISSGIKSGATSSATAEAAIEVMGRLNRAASEAMIAVGVAAATDVTGFGLIGHLIGMLGPSANAELYMEHIPVVPEAIELAASGTLPGGSKRNFEALADVVHAHGIERELLLMLFDAQTSGGLLIAVPQERTSFLRDELSERGVMDAATIGRVVAGEGVIEVIGS